MRNLARTAHRSAVARRPRVSRIPRSNPTRGLVCALLLVSAPCFATGQSSLLVVSGIGGEPVYSERFAAWSRTMVQAAVSNLDMARNRVVYLAEEISEDVDAQSTKREIENAIRHLADTAEPGDTIFLLLIGHGTARGDRVLFNLPGPDVSAAELDALLEPHHDLRWVIVNTAPSSGPFAALLSGPNRVVITATSSAAERFHTLFPDHFVAAYAGEGADTDKNGRVSVLEAFEYARREVQRSYTSDGRLQSEHALLDDSTDLARASYLESDRAIYASSLPAEELERLLAERDALEMRIESLKDQKELLSPVVYDDRLESLLVKFALVHRALRKPKTK